MNTLLLEKLKPITQEEQEILNGKKDIKKELYTSGNRFIIDSRKLLAPSRLIEIRPHTRFIHFPKHTHNYVEMVYMCQGTTEHIIGGTEHIILNSGDLLLMNQHAVHEVLPASEDDIAINFIIMPEFFPYTMELIDHQNSLFEFLTSVLSSSEPDCDYLYFRVGNVAPVQNLVENLIWNINRSHATFCSENPHQPRVPDLMADSYESFNNINHLTMGLLFLTLTEYADTLSQTKSSSYEQKLVLSVLKYIEHNYKDGTLEYIAGQYHLAPYTLSRILKKQTGNSFKELLVQQKMTRAAWLLTNTSLSTEEIFHAVGYENSSYFHKKFREIYHQTPKEYRNSNH